MFSKKRISVVFGILMIASMVLAACAPATPAVQTIVVTQVVEKEDIAGGGAVHYANGPIGRMKRKGGVTDDGNEQQMDRQAIDEFELGL